MVPVQWEVSVCLLHSAKFPPTAPTGSGAVFPKAPPMTTTNTPTVHPRRRATLTPTTTPTSPTVLAHHRVVEVVESRGSDEASI